MRAALWFVTLFAVAVAVALFAGNDHSTVTLFLPPARRVDLALNFVLLLATVLFALVWLAVQALTALLALPREARRWRTAHHERQIQAGLLDAMAHLMAGRFIRARKTAERVVAQTQMVMGDDTLPATSAQARHVTRLRAMLHVLAAEAAHALQDRALRDRHMQDALAACVNREQQDLREAVQLAATRWAVQDRDLPLAEQRFAELPQGAARRTVALRLKFKIARLGASPLAALDVARLLGKHGAFSAQATPSLLRSLALETLASARDAAQLAQTWASLDSLEQAMPEVAAAAAKKMLLLQGEPARVLDILLSIWERMVAEPSAFESAQQTVVVQALAQAFAAQPGGPDAAWLRRIEQAQLKQAHDPCLQYLAGMACLHRQLWGKAQQLLQQAVLALTDGELRRSAWLALAYLAEQRQDPVAAAKAWREAAGVGAVSQLYLPRA